MSEILHCVQYDNDLETTIAHQRGCEKLTNYAYVSGYRWINGMIHLFLFDEHSAFDQPSFRMFGCAVTDEVHAQGHVIFGCATRLNPAKPLSVMQGRSNDLNGRGIVTVAVHLTGIQATSFDCVADDFSIPQMQIVNDAVGIVAHSEAKSCQVTLYNSTNQIVAVLQLAIPTPQA